MQASQRQVQEYSQLLQSPSNGAHEHVSGALCDRCLQPIDEATFRSNLQRLGAEADSAAAAHRAVAERASATQVPKTFLAFHCNMRYVASAISIRLVDQECGWPCLQASMKAKLPQGECQPIEACCRHRLHPHHMRNILLWVDCVPATASFSVRVRFRTGASSGRRGLYKRVITCQKHGKQLWICLCRGRWKWPGQGWTRPSKP